MGTTNCEPKLTNASKRAQVWFQLPLVFSRAFLQPLNMTHGARSKSNSLMTLSALGETHGPERKLEITPRDGGTRLQLQYGKLRQLRMTAHGDLEANVGMWLDLTNIWIRVPIKAAIEDHTAMLTERRIRISQKACVQAVR